MKSWVDASLELVNPTPTPTVISEIPTTGMNSEIPTTGMNSEIPTTGMNSEIPTTELETPSTTPNKTQKLHVHGGLAFLFLLFSVTMSCR